MWKEYFQGLTQNCEVAPPATVSQFAIAESSLKVAVPRPLCELLSECNGVAGEYGEGLVWSIERIIEDNLAFRANVDFRELYMPFDNLLFFADASNGDLFAFPIDGDGTIHRFEVFAWNHETDSRTWVAPSLKIHLDSNLSGKIRV